jgi:hypothetical protein
MKINVKKFFISAKKKTRETYNGGEEEESVKNEYEWNETQV